MKKFIIPGLMAAALTSVSTIALAQSTTAPTIEKKDPPQTESTQDPATGAMKPKDVTAPAATGASTTGTAATASPMVVTQAQGEKWVSKRVYSTDGSDIGEIAAMKVGADGNVEYFHTDIGGFLGIGETSVKVKPDQFEMREDKLYLGMTKEAAKNLPRVTDTAQEKK